MCESLILVLLENDDKTIVRILLELLVTWPLRLCVIRIMEWLLTTSRLELWHLNACLGEDLIMVDLGKKLGKLF